MHPTYQTPVNTILLQFVLSVICGLGFGLWLGPDVAFFLLQGLMLVIAVIVVYSLANVGVMWYYWRERRDEFNAIMFVMNRRGREQWLMRAGAIVAEAEAPA